MRHRMIIVCSALMLALVTVLIAPSLLKGQDQPVQGQQNPQGQAQPGGRGQQGARGRGQPTGPSKPTPRWPDGRPILGAAPGEKGIWGSCCGSLSNAQTPYQPWAKALYDYRRTNEFEPHTRCKASGGARQFVTPYGTELVEAPDLKRIFIFDIGGPHSFRVIYVDGSSHPKDLVPSYYGDSRGHWEGDTLVVETIGFNEAFWMDRAGSPHTEKLRFTEKFTRTDYDTLRYEVTVDDPGAYTATWSNSFQMRWTANQELFEFICQENNFARVLLVGEQEKVDRTTIIIP